MKNAKLNLALVGSMMILFTACNKEEATIENENSLTEEEAVELVSQSLTSDVYGITAQGNDARSLDAEESNKMAEECAVLKEDSRQVNSADGATITYSHAIDYSFTLLCENNVPSAYAIDFESNGTYSSQRLSSDDTITYNAVLGQIIAPSSPYVYNSTLVRRGTQETRINGNQKNFESSLTIESSEVRIDKANYAILSGTSNFSLTGVLSTGETFSYTGSVTYMGNRAATIELNGSTYNINL